MFKKGWGTALRQLLPMPEESPATSQCLGFAFCHIKEGSKMLITTAITTAGSRRRQAVEVRCSETKMMSGVGAWPDNAGTASAALGEPATGQGVAR